MRILRATAENIQLAAEIVKKGGLVVYPTDTLYGLGCAPLNTEAVKRVFKTKGERKKPLPVLAYSIADAERIAEFGEKAKLIAERFWPGPLTLVLPKKPSLPSVVTYGKPSVGVRVPKHKVALQLLFLSNGLLIGTSANKTGSNPPRTAQEAAEQIGENVDLILDGGKTPIGKSSTVVELSEGIPKLLREGPISINDILNVLKHG